ncbi:MAG: hypothetical protein KC592_15295, partial [Nitrospira sp.]|nr:hypothetical protein [Nitrospira sp.]
RVDSNDQIQYSSMRLPLPKYSHFNSPHTESTRFYEQIQPRPFSPAPALTVFVARPSSQSALLYPASPS